MPDVSEPDTDVVIVGAGAAGLAVGAVLGRLGIGCELIDRDPAIGASWRSRYERLHLHTDRGRSGLPFTAMPRSLPRYPSKDQVADYLLDYASEHGLTPHLGCTVTSVARCDDLWHTETADRSWTARCVVIATSTNGQPFVPRFEGQDRYRGSITHSSTYVDGEHLRGHDVLVVGFGNSGGEIAIDLYEHGARPTVAVRSAVNVLPRDLLGIPILGWGIALSKLPPRLADLLAGPLLRLRVGDITRHGLRRLPYGPNVQIARHGQIPLLDIGTIDLIERGEISVRGGIDRFDERGVIFDDGERGDFDEVILATGFTPRLDRFVDAALLDEQGAPPVSGGEIAPGLYTCGYRVSPTGMLREIGIEARRIGDHIRDEHFSRA